jgi:hypothetical protein
MNETIMIKNWGEGVWNVFILLRTRLSDEVQ